MVPSSDGGDDLVRVLGPAEGTRVIVGFGEEPVDGGLERDDGVEDAAFEALLAQLGEEAFNRVEPGGGGRGEVEGPTRVTLQPLQHFWVLVGGVVIDDGMDQLAYRNRRLDGVEEADELLMPMALHTTADHASV